MKKRLAILICLAMLMNLAAACGSGSKETTKKKTKKTSKTKVSKVIDDTEPDDDTEPPKTTTEEPTTTTTDPDANIQIEKAETETLNWVEVKDMYGYTSITVPDTWEVNFVMADLIGYGIIASDKTCPDRFFIFQLLASPFTKSKEAHDFWAQNASGDYMGGTNDFVNHPYLTNPTTEGFFTDCGPGYLMINDFEKVATLEEDNILFGNVLEGTCTSPNGGKVTGIFGAIPWNNLDYPMYGIDCGFYSVSNVLVMAAPEEDYTNWMPVMTQMLNSIVFTEEFMQERNREWQQIIGTSIYLGKIADQMGDMIMDTWNNSMDSYDIISQRQSDATLGRERVVDTETGDIYYAPNGFSDDYTGSRFEPLPDNDPRYRDAVSGTITYG